MTEPAAGDAVTRQPPRQRTTRAVIVALAIAAVASFVVWNGIFGLHVSRGEKQYLLEQARHALGQRPEPSVSTIMADTVHEGARQANRWAAVVFLASLCASYSGARLSPWRARPPR